MTMVFGGDFRQVLLIILNCSWQDIVSTSFKQSYLWDHCNVLKLIANMRLIVGAHPKDVTKILEFAEWILKVEDGEIKEHYDGEVSIDLPEEILLDAADDSVTSIVDFTYLNILDNINDSSYFQKRMEIYLKLLQMSSTKKYYKVYKQRARGVHEMDIGY
ncbi:ATP-dependent DNA helicase PFH1-like protein [Tanacetum coccineum]